VDVAVSIPLGVAVFFLAGRLLNIEELEMAMTALGRFNPLRVLKFRNR